MPFHLTPSKTFPFTPQALRGQADAPTFTLRSLPARLMLELTPLVEENQGKAMVAFARAGLVGWSGVCNEDGTAAQFKPAGKRLVYGVEVDGGAADEIVDALPAVTVAEIGMAVLTGNKLDLETAKN